MRRRIIRKCGAVMLVWIAVTAAAGASVYCLKHSRDMPANLETATQIQEEQSDAAGCQICVDCAETGNESESDSGTGELQKQGQCCYLKNVPHLYQMDAFPTGCESVAAVSLMQFYGIDISVAEFICKYLPTAAVPALGEDGVTLYGESPWEYFIGDPTSVSGYGCYATVILQAMQSAVPADYLVQSLDAVSLDALTKQYTAAGTPVLVWATIGMQQCHPGRSWILPDGSTFTFFSPEHALLLIGADEDCYYFSDSMSEEQVTTYPKATCEDAFAAMGSQAIVITPPEG